MDAVGLLTDQPCSFGNGTTGYDQLQFETGGDPPLGVPHLLEVTFDIPSDLWRVWLDGVLVLSTEHSGNVLEHIRFNLTGDHADNSVAVDNIQLYGENLPIHHVCCVGEECYLTTQDECPAMLGEYHWEWDACEPVNPCASTPARESSWGTIKSAFK